LYALCGCLLHAQLIGAALLALGCWYLADTRSSKLNDVSKSSGLTSLFHSAAIIICVVGVVIILVAVLGCFAASREFYLCLVVVRKHTLMSSLLTHTQQCLEKTQPFCSTAGKEITLICIKFGADLINTFDVTSRKAKWLRF